jgi:hypothetical protein
MKTLFRKIKNRLSNRADAITLVVPKGCILVSSQRPLKNGETEHTFWAE